MKLSYLLSLSVFHASVAAQSENCSATTQFLSDPPYDNYFYSDCDVDAQVVITSPLPDSNLTIIGPRLIIAWPAGNSGIAAFFQPQDGPNGTLAIELVNSTIGTPLAAYVQDSNASVSPNGTESSNSSGHPYVGVQGILSFNASAALTIPILGSVRTIRDFTEGPSLLRPVIQDAINVSQYNDTGAAISRLWLDNETVSTLTLVPWQNANASIQIGSEGKNVTFGAGYYHFEAFFNYPQLQQLTPEEVLNNNSQGLIQQEPSQTTSLSFLSYSEKLLAGAWRFLTYFGRDSMISALLLEPVLSTGNASALEAVIGAVLERINRTDGSVCHEETIGDYATYLHLLQNVTSTAAIFTYPMIDTDFYLPVLMYSYFSKYPDRIDALLSIEAGTIDVDNSNLTYADLALLNAQRIINETAAFLDDQSVENLIHLKEGEIVGNWRDSTYGLANGRIPFDVNCALAPAALRAIGQLAGLGGVYPNSSSKTAVLTNYSGWPTFALEAAQTWEEYTLPFFEVNLTESEASSRLNQFVDTSTFYSGPTYNSSLSTYSDGSNSTTTFYALALNGSESLNASSEAYADPIPIMHTDTGFHLFFLNLTNTSSDSYGQTYTRFLNSTANSILRAFPAGLLTPSGMVVANPALSGSDVLIANFTNSAYHGTVIWSFQLALMAAGLHRQLAACNSTGSGNFTPAYCNDDSVYNATLSAYNVLWDNIEQNQAQLESEVWSWSYSAPMSSNSTSNMTSSTSVMGNGTSMNGFSTVDGFTTVPLGSLPPPPGVSGSTESNIRQLWSLTFLAVTRDQSYSMSA